MSVNATGHNSFTLDADELMHDGAITATGVGTVSAAPIQVDFGATDVNGVENIAYTPCQLVIEVNAQEVDTGDENYIIIFQLANGTDFTTATAVHDRAMLPLGPVLYGTNADVWAATDLGRVTLGVDNEMLGVMYRFGRVLHMVPAGTIVTGLDYTAYLARNK